MARNYFPLLVSFMTIVKHIWQRTKSQLVSVQATTEW